MPRALWPLLHERPSIQVILTETRTGQSQSRLLLADTGAGTAHSDFDLILPESDCLMTGGVTGPGIVLTGAYNGSFPRYWVRVRIPMVGFDHTVFVVAVPVVPDDLDGIACFAFLNRFSYGNFGNPTLFGRER